MKNKKSFDDMNACEIIDYASEIVKDISLGLEIVKDVFCQEEDKADEKCDECPHKNLLEPFILLTKSKCDEFRNEMNCEFGGAAADFLTKLFDNEWKAMPKQTIQRCKMNPENSVVSNEN